MLQWLLRGVVLQLIQWHVCLNWVICCSLCPTQKCYSMKNRLFEENMDIGELFRDGRVGEQGIVDINGKAKRKVQIRSLDGSRG